MGFQNASTHTFYNALNSTDKDSFELRCLVGTSVKKTKAVVAKNGVQALQPSSSSDVARTQRNGSGINLDRKNKPQLPPPNMYHDNIQGHSDVSKKICKDRHSPNDASVEKMQNQGQHCNPKWQNLTDIAFKFVTANTDFYFRFRKTLPGNTITNPKEDLKDWKQWKNERDWQGTPLNENCSSGLPVNNYQRTSGPWRFLIPCEFTGFLQQRIGRDLVRALISCLIIHALIDVYGGEITLRVGKEAITFNLDQTSKYTADYDHMTANKIDVIEMACDEYSQGEEKMFQTSSEVDPTYQDPEGDILILEAILNSEPPPPLPNHEQYMPGGRKELKLCEAKTVESSVNEPPEVELKELPPHLEYAFLEGPWVSPVHCVPKKGGMTVITNEENELIPTRLVTGWRVCIDYRKLNEATRKDHFPLPFMDQMLERLAGNEYYCFLDGFSGYFQIPIDPKDQEKTTFTCPYGTFAYRRMPFGLCNAPGTFQRCMMAIFHDMIEKTMEVFMDDFSVFGDSFSTCLTHLEKMLKRCEDTNLSLNWEKSHFMICDDQVIRRCVSGASSFRHSQSFATVEPTGGTLWCQITQQEKSSIQESSTRDQAYENSLIYKEKTKRIHDAKIKNRVFNVGDRVLLFNSRLKIFSGKLKSRWSGPFTIVQVFPYGTVELSQNSGPNFKVNGHRDFPDCEDSRACSILHEFHILSFILGIQKRGLGTDNQEKDEKQSQNDKTGLGMEKTVKDKAKSKPESQSSQKVNRKVNWSKTKSTQVNSEAKVKKI
ncbi:reverse transcriptase domain-containing protein [Tanacetum coccineum]